MDAGEVVAAEPEAATGILVISPCDEDLSSVRAIFAHTTWCVSGARTHEEARRFLSGHSVAIVISERDLPDGNWREVLDDLESLRRPPPLIVASLYADDQLWSEVLNLNGYDVLLKPFDPEEVSRVASAARRAGGRSARSTARPGPLPIRRRNRRPSSVVGLEQKGDIR